jgi:uncharacterized protein YndB with AHSA1/START domain
MRTLITTLAVMSLGAAARAEVVDVQATGFQVKRTADIKAPPETVWRTLVQPSAWWNSAHSFSGDASNMVLEPRPGGCFCERTANGAGAWTVTVVVVQPGKTLILRGPLGPLASLGDDAAWSIQLEPTAEGARMTWTYTVGGYAPGGLDKLAAPVDHVLGEQLDRLKARAEAGGA